jgi:hypothetical protein
LSGDSRRWLEVLIAILFVIGGFGGGFWLAQSGFEDIRALRALERVPVSSRVGAVLPGDAVVRAPARSLGVVVRSPRSDTPSLYYRYLHEVETRDSDGDRSWNVRTDRSRAVDFELADASGRIRVPAQQDFSAIRFHVARKFQDRSGRNRYTEWRIDPGDPVLVAGRVERSSSGTSFDLAAGRPVAPLISSFDAVSERSGQGMRGVLGLWGGLGLIGLGVFGVVMLLRIHRALAFLSLLGLVLALTVIHFGLRMMHADLAAAAESWQLRETGARARFAGAFREAGQHWPGLETLGDLDAARYRALPAQERANLRQIREDLELARRRLESQYRAFPERWMVAAQGRSIPAAPELPPALAQRVEERAAAYRPTRLQAGWVGFAVAAGFLLALGATWYGFRRIRVKRWIENLPTSKAAGAACGLVELSGRVRVPEDEPPIEAPLSMRDCVWYHYRVREKRRSGKRTRWVTVEDRSAGMPFLCEDDSGRIAIDPADAEVVSRHRMRRRRGDRIHIEQTLQPGDDCYALGLARVDREAGDRLRLGKGSDDEPFLLGNLPERVLMLRKALAGMLSLDLAMVALTGALLLWFAALGSFSPLDFLLAALVAPVYMALVMLVLHYNDLLFLRERARRNWANIQVSLRKRRNLIRPLQQLASRYLEHERELQERLAAMRSELRTATEDPTAAGRYLAAESALDTEFRAVVEQYPQLKGARAVARLSASLTRLENEIALMRTGYNDAVEHYNTRVESFPDLVFARAFRFLRMDPV